MPIHPTPPVGGAPAGGEGRVEYLYFVYLDPRLFMRFLLVLWQYMHIPLDTAATGALKRCGASDTLITPASSRIGRATSCTSIVCIQGGRSWQNFTNA